MKYIAECGQCSAGTLVRSFLTEAERDAWVRYHTEGVGHTVTKREETEASDER